MKRFLTRLVCFALALLYVAALTPAAMAAADTDTAEQLKQLLRGEEGLDLSALYTAKIPSGTYGDMAANSARYVSINILVHTAITAAMKKLAPNAQLSIATALSWQALGALYRNLSNEELTALLIDGLRVDSTTQGEQTQLTISYPSLMELAAATDADASFAVLMDAAYLNTRYDETGAEMDYVHPLVSRAVLREMTYPLEERYISALKPCWYKPRTHGLRLHMGTDLRVPRLSPIFSCTDGVVEYAGYAVTPGNYVCVLGDDGYRYLYFHISKNATYVTVGQRVARGDTLAGVGNTGNSVANHLHLSIITPSLCFIDPYLVLQDMLKLKQTLAALPERGEEAAAAEQLVQ